MNRKEIQQLLETLVALDNLIVDDEIKQNEIYEDFEQWIETLDSKLED